MQAVRFVAVGELLVDVVATGVGHDARIRVRPGGSAFNAAVAAAAAGADAAVIGAVGDDAAGRMILAELEALGVSAQVSVDAGAPTGTFLVAGGEIRVDRGASAAAALPETIEGDAVLVSGYLAAAGEALRRAHAPWVALDAAALADLPSDPPCVLANEEAARRLTGLEPEQAARALAAGRRLACVTLGARGAVAVLDGRVERAEPPAAAPDAPGSGDAFAASLLTSLASGRDLAEALGKACRAALHVLAES